MAERRILNPGEKETVRGNFRDICYICETTLNDYDASEIEYDHIYDYAGGYPQELSDFAPVHASARPDRLNCHKDKGRKSPYEYKEEKRIERVMQGVTGLGDLCQQPTSIDIQLDYPGRKVIFAGLTLPLYSQKLDGTDHWYFYHEIPVRYLANDDLIQLRPLEPKIFPLIAHLRHSVQLLPSIGRYDTQSRVVKIFDGQHKAVAQIVGNGRDAIPCIVFVDPDVDDLRVIVVEAHTDLLQQRYKRSHMADKLAAIYQERIDAYRDAVGNPNAPFTEATILRGDSRAKVRQFTIAQIIDELRSHSPFVERYVAEDRRQQRGPNAKPMIWQTLELFIATFAETKAVTTTSDDPANYREDEVKNLAFLLGQIESHMISGKWNPQVPDSEQHKLARNYFYDKASTVWIKEMEKALRYAFDQLQGIVVPGQICYRPILTDDVRRRFIGIFERLAIHGVWINPGYQATIGGNSERDIEALFNNQGLEYIYLTDLRSWS